MIDQAINEQLVKIRRHLNQNPELGYKEFNTSDFIYKELDKLNISYRRNIAKTGIVAEIEKGEGASIALRADMDALPIQEDANIDFKSTNNGVMHACGHDVHTTMLLGACILLKDSSFNGKIKFIFQPSEEGVYDYPENKSGGQRIVEAGELDNVKYALGLHVHPLLEVGTLAFGSGEALACTNFFTINIYGKAGHAGAAPQMGIDAILVASNLIMNLNTIVSRNISPTQPGVISITKISGGTAPNIIPDHVIIEGTVRSLYIDNYKSMVDRINTIIDGVAISFGAKIDLKIDLFYPSLLNDNEVNNKLTQIAKIVL
jgi:amidohydrolase